MSRRPGGWTRGEVVALLVILLVGAALRAAWLAELRHDPLVAAPALDAQLHDYWARGLATGEWTPPEGVDDPQLRTTPYFRPPGYPYFLAGLYAVVGDGALAPRIAQFGLGLASCVLGFLFARRWFGSAVGLVLAAFMATHWVFVYFDGQLVDPVLLTFLVLAMLAALARAADTGRAAPGLAAGALAGLAVLTRPNVLLFLPFAAGWLAWASRRRAPGRPRWPVIAGFLVGAAVLVAPATVRNRVVAGEWVLISSNGGINLYIGNNPEADGVHAAIPGIRELTGKTGWTCFDYPAVVEGLGRRLGRDVSHAEASRIWASRAWRYIVEHPARTLALTARRAALIWGPVELEDRDVGLTRRASPVLRRIPTGFPPVLASAIVGAILLVGERRRTSTADGDSRGRLEVAALLGLFVVVYSSSFLPFFFNARYRVPLLPVLGTFGAWAWVELARRALRGDYRRAVAGLAAVGVLWVLASVNLSGYEPRPEEWHYQLGNAYRAEGDVDRAIEAYRQALRLRPDYSAAHNDLGLLLLGRGRVDEAVASFRSALETDPGLADARFNLANVLVRSGRVDEAIEQFRLGIEADPLDARARIAYGSALLLRGDAGAALEQYAAAEELSPRDPMVHIALGRAYLHTGRPTEARAALERAVALAPERALPHFLLGELARHERRTDDATRHYRDALRADPAFEPAARALAAQADE